MKKNKSLFLFMSVMICGLLSISYVNNIATINQDEEINYHGARATLHGPRYTNSDLLKEPEGKQSFRQNFLTMNLGGDSISSASVWENYRGENIDPSKKVTVAIIDSGLDIYHEDFLKPEARGVKLNSSNINDYSIIDSRSCYIHDPTNYGDYIKDVVTDVGISYAYDQETYDPQYKDYYSHGTACAYLIGGRINGVGGFGIAPYINLLIIRCDLFFTSLDVAIRYAADNGADIISMSVGAFSESFIDGFGDKQEGASVVATFLEDAISYAHKKDAIILASAGNENTDHKSYPACNTGVIGVGALDNLSKTTKAEFSNFNSKNDSEASENNVDIMAPGFAYTANVPQMNRTNNTYREADSYYSESAGTSFSCPLAAGALALYRAKNIDEKREDVINALYASCYDIGEAGWDKTFGYGRVDVNSLLSDTVKVSDVVVSPETLTLNRTDDNPFPSATLSASFLPNDASSYYKKGLWVSDNKEVATVDEKSGVVTAKGKGSATISYVTDVDNIKGSCQVTVTGDVNLIEVEDSFKITPNDHKLTGAYKWQNWKVDSFEGESFVYGGKKDRLQFNSNQKAHFLFNKTAVPGPITSITIKGNEKNWKLLTNDTPYKEMYDIPSNGHNQGTKIINSYGTTFDVNTKDTYFALCYLGSGAGYLDEIVVNYLTYKVSAKSISLDKENITLKVGSETTLKATSSTPVTWSNLDETVASFKDGVITALKVGKTIITASNDKDSVSCQVSVIPNYSLKDITLSGTDNLVVPFKGKLDTSKIIVTASYTNNVEDKIVDATFSELDTNSIGVKSVVASYEEFDVKIFKTFDVIVTNLGASREETIKDREIIDVTTSNDNYFKDDHGFITGGDNSTWNLNVSKTNSDNETYYGYLGGNNAGAQIGSKKSEIPNALDITSSDFDSKMIEKIEIKTKCEDALLSVSVGDKEYTCNDLNNTKLTYSTNTCVFTGLNKGPIKISYKNITHPVILCSIKVTVAISTTYSWSADEQAASFISYLKTFRSCANDFEDRESIVTLVNEYNYMLQEAKDSDLMNETFTDYSYQTTAIDKLKMIVNQYNSTLKTGERKLIIISESNNYEEPLKVYNDNSDANILPINSSVMNIAVISSVLLIIGVSIFLVIKRK